jgi:hypothetical protein
MNRFSGLRFVAPALFTGLLLSACETLPPATTATTPTAPTTPVAPVPTAPVITPRVAAAAEALTKMAAMQDRLYRVAAPLLINNADLCKGQARNLLGFTARNRYWYPGDYNEGSQVAFDMGERLKVTSVLAGSGAARAGLRRGDELISAGGKQLPTGPNASGSAGAVFGPLVAASATLPMVIERDDKNRQLTIPVTRACGFAIELGNSDNINSYADGSRVMVTRGMLHFAQSDEELAVILAKGMAHNILGHAATTNSTATVGSVITNLASVKPDTSLLIGSAGIRPMSADHDSAADNLSLYLLARGGYNVDAAIPFWKRLDKAYPATVLNGYVANHPATGARMTALAASLTEVKSKLVNKKPLTP